MLWSLQLRISLTELDRRWDDILDKREYHGEAINMKNLSIFEIMLGIGKARLPLPESLPSALRSVIAAVKVMGCVMHGVA